MFKIALFTPTSNQPMPHPNLPAGLKLVSEHLLTTGATSSQLGTTYFGLLLVATLAQSQAHPCWILPSLTPIPGMGEHAPSSLCHMGIHADTASADAHAQRCSKSRVCPQSFCSSRWSLWSPCCEKQARCYATARRVKANLPSTKDPS